MAKKLSEIHRTAAFAWSPGHQIPFIAAGTVAGALDDSFSNASVLEIFKLDFSSSDTKGLAPAGKVNSNARFNTLVWGNATAEKPYGIIVGGLENGELELWDPAAILESKSEEEALILRNSTHTGSLRELDFNPLQPNLLASVGSNNEIYIWDLSQPSKPYAPGARSSKLTDITSVAWNCQVPHILSTSSTTGNTVVWDLRNRKEVMTLAYAGQSAGGMGASGRLGISSAAWHPDVATQLVTACEDDNNPIITLWDLRHAHSPEKSLTGHQKGVLGVSWCHQDSELLLSCGKDSRTLCWNPRTGEMLGQISQNTNWTFQAEWSPRNPDLLASASFDGQINVFSLQGAVNEGLTTEEPQTTHADDPFSAAILAAAPIQQSFSLKQPPKWLRRPVGASFSFSGKLVSFNNKAGQAVDTLAATSAPTPQHVPRHVSIATVVTNPEIVQRSTALETAVDQQLLEKFIEDRQKQIGDNKEELEDWEVIQALFAEHAREQLMRHLGFEKDQAVSVVAAVLDKKEAETGVKSTEDESKAENELEVEAVEQVEENGVKESEETPEEAKENETPGSTDALSGLFKSDTQSSDQDFFGKASEMNLSATTAIPDLEPLELYPSSSSETDRVITRSIVSGDFESAVQLCLANDRLSDALMLAICGGSDLLARTQKAYFERQAKNTSYLRLLENIVNEDLTGIVESALLEDWASVFVILCSFAQVEQFSSLCEILGGRLEAAGKEHIQHALLCYLAAGSLEKVTKIWIAQQENSQDDTGMNLQNLIEKVTVFRKAIGFEDTALTGEQEQKYDLTPLYEKYCEYAELLASQGKLDIALKYINLTPSSHQQAEHLSVIRDRIYRAQACNGDATYKESSFPFEKNPLGVTDTAAEVDAAFGQATEQPISGSAYEPSAEYAQPQQQPQYQPQQEQRSYQATQPQQVQQTYQSYQPYQPYQPYQAPQSYQPYQPQQQVEQPAMRGPTPPPKASTGAWNDPPMISNPNVAKSAAAAPAGPKRVVSPFPNTPAPAAFISSPPQHGYMQPPRQQAAAPLPPPPMNASAPIPLARQPQPTVNYAQQQPRPVQAASRPPPAMQSPARPAPFQPPQAMPAPPTMAAGGSGPYAPNVPSAAPGPHAPPMPPGSSGPYAPSMAAGQAGPYAPPSAAPVGPYASPPMGAATGASLPPRQPSAQQGQAQPGNVLAAQSPPPPKPAAPTAPEKKRHPPNDRSHISPEHRPIYEILSKELQHAKQRAPAGQQKKMLDDAERRIGVLFDQLNNGDISGDVAKLMLSITNALEHKDYDTAQRIQVDMVTTRYEECGSWLMGVKRVIDSAKQTAM
ncbi:protein transport protein S31 [Apophysomyces ossiformis]|uniref:Protein transport protein SEC31 n=1 Tax=Apophysomyces ossiformis TaxID=679940 RepID=A0A8H7BMC1_9FUNG|nr:protein transport protein S31 [Apophysomyces ossiformis]